MGLTISFCEECGSLLLPKKKGNKKVLVCRVCEKEYPFDAAKEYRIGHRKEPEAKKTNAVIEEPEDRKISEEDREANEDYFM
ncbi:MAG TPA: hypothetical protein VKK79_10510, partial [Candidatus Lokiarchaeia archaeon]|nr:hypothetical protein [Candidatus Lokiarchaeia archaeon]